MKIKFMIQKKNSCVPLAREETKLVKKTSKFACLLPNIFIIRCLSYVLNNDCGILPLNTELIYYFTMCSFWGHQSKLQQQKKYKCKTVNTTMNILKRCN